MMRKRVIRTESADEHLPAEPWLDLAMFAVVELSSEDPAYPIEAALRSEAAGWRAATPGPQTIRLVFDAPQTIRRIRLVFREPAHQRTQEFVLRWSADGGRSVNDIVRQQYNLNPPGEEIEDYRVELHGATMIALEITPDIGGGPAYATLASFQVGS